MPLFLPDPSAAPVVRASLAHARHLETTMIAKFSLPRARTATAVVLASGVCLVFAASTASAATPLTVPPNAKTTCMIAASSGYSAVEGAISADQAGNASTAAADDATALSDINPVSSECYYVNPNSIYWQILNSNAALQSAQSANTSGNTASALSTEQSVAPVLYNIFLTLFNQPPQ